MLDMDGTILDLAFDNYIWKNLVPRRYAAANNMSFEEAREQLFAKYRAVQGDLDWYCLDHWNDRLGIDVVKIHHDVTYRIGYLPGALEFLRKIASGDKRVLLVTNSHPDTLALKDEVTGLVEYFDAIYSSHQFGYAKERQEFWHALREEENFERESTLFVDDNQVVLKSAETYGLGMLLEINHPDTSEPARESSAYTGVIGVADLLS